MKRPRIVIGINSLSVASHSAYSNHLQVFYELGKRYSPRYEFYFVNPPRMSIDRMRNLAAETALDIEAEYLLFLDDDVLIPAPFDFLDKLIACRADVAAADVLIRGYPFNHMLFRWTKGKSGLVQMKNVPKKLGTIPVGAVGFSCCLIKAAIFKKLPKPYFITGLANTEDIYFCVRIQQELKKIKIVADTSIQCGHILWDEIIDAKSKPNYKTYWEKQFGKPSLTNDAEFRGPKYLKEVEEALDVA